MKPEKEREYGINQIAEMFGLPVLTIYYYDRMGLLPEFERRGKKRIFTENHIRTLKMIECLKNAHTEITDIRDFMDLVSQGEETFEQRRQFFREREKDIEVQMETLQKSLDLARCKCWYYEEAIRRGSEDGLCELDPAEVPENVRAAYLSFYEGEEKPEKKA